MIRSRQPRPAPHRETSRCRPSPTLICLSSASRHSPLPQTRHTRHNSTRRYRRNSSAINRIRTLSATHGGVPPCSLTTLNFPLRTALFARVHINIIPNALAFLCFHTLTHSFATRKTLTPVFSIIPALFAQNTRGGGWLRSAPSSHKGLHLSNVIRRGRAAGSTACL